MEVGAAGAAINGGSDFIEVHVAQRDSDRAALRQHLPPEWAPQSAVLLTWPRADGDWGAGLPQAERAFRAIATAISRRQTVMIACADANACRAVGATLSDDGAVMHRVRCHVAPSDDVWARDHGPVAVLRDGKPVLLKFRFNGWGAKYPSERDDTVAETLWRQGAFGQTSLEAIDLVLEGGAIEVDGHGTLLATRRSVLHPNRNPGHSEVEIGRILKRALGVDAIHWLSHGALIGDDTDGHIDTLARFTDPGTIAHQVCADTEDPHFQPLRALTEELRALRCPDGKPYALKPLPLPRPIFDADGTRLPAGYANFLIINGAVLMPAYDDPADATAADILRACFSDREIVPIDCRALIRQYGGLHCATMQLPKAIAL